MNLKFGYGLVIVVLLFTLPLFGHLDQMPLQAWDESRLAVNAIEMLQNHNFMVTHYHNSPDMWNTKPPFMIWMQVLSMKFWGVSTLSIRLPSALAAAFTCLLIFWFVARKLRLPWLGVFSVLVLITFPGYVVNHGTRTGDYDSLLVLFTTAYLLFFFLHLETGSRKWLALFFAALTGAVLTKGIAGLLFTPALLVYACTRRQTLQTLKMPWFYIGIALFVLLGLGYYLLREHYNPGYIAAVSANELGGRYMTIIEHHEESNWYYWDNLIDNQLNYWYLLVPCGIAIGLAATDKRLYRFTALLTIASTCFLLIISTAGTKLRWYTLPALPLLAMLCGIALWYLFSLLAASGNWKNFQRVNVLPFLVIALLALLPYRQIIGTVLDPKSDPWMNESVSIGNFLQENLEGRRKDTAVHLFLNGEEQHVIWYLQALEMKGINLPVVHFREILPGQKVAVYSGENQTMLDSAFYIHVAEQISGVTIFSIDSLKHTDSLIHRE